MTDPGQPPEPNEEQIRAFEEQLKRIRVEDVLVQTLVTLVNLGARRLGLTGEPGTRDLEQAQLAIEGARALMPLVPGDELGPIREALSQLQVAFAREAQGGAQPEGDAPQPPAGDQPAQPPQEQAQSDEEREKARSKIWTPPGT
jgi:ribosomal protein L12E/L44/L45/RPP1/RPP2